MRPAPLAAAFAVVLSSAGLAALMPDPGLPHYPHAPLRAHVALGPVQVLARPEPDPLHPAPSLAEAARARYGAVDALAAVRPVPLPGAPGGALVGLAIRWVDPPR
jgi:hypothetical protein